jgi:hypothetical protein
VTRRYLVPWYDVSWDDLEQAMAEAGAVPADPEEGVLAAWRRGDTGIHLFEEGVTQLAVDGDDADRVAEDLGRRIRTYGPGDMPAVFDDPIYGWDLRLAILAAVAPATADPALVELFRRGFDHDDPHVRVTAALSAAIPAWPELRADIELLATSDPEERVRRPAAKVLATMDGAAPA